MVLKIVAMFQAVVILVFSLVKDALSYVDHCIIVGDSMQQIDALIQLLHGGDEHIVLQDKGLIDKYLGVNITQIDVNTFELVQPFLIKRIPAFLEIKKGKTNEKITPVGKPHLNKDLQGFPKSMIGNIVERLVC
jgi:hypothetical protein